MRVRQRRSTLRSYGFFNLQSLPTPHSLYLRIGFDAGGCLP